MGRVKINGHYIARSN